MYKANNFLSRKGKSMHKLLEMASNLISKERLADVVIGEISESLQEHGYKIVKIREAREKDEYSKPTKKKPKPKPGQKKKAVSTSKKEAWKQWPRQVNGIKYDSLADFCRHNDLKTFNARYHLSRGKTLEELIQGEDLELTQQTAEEIENKPKTILRKKRA